MGKTKFFRKQSFAEDGRNLLISVYKSGEMSNANFSENYVLRKQEEICGFRLKSDKNGENQFSRKLRFAGVRRNLRILV